MKYLIAICMIFTVIGQMQSVLIDMKNNGTGFYLALYSNGTVLSLPVSIPNSPTDIATKSTSRGYVICLVNDAKALDSDATLGMPSGTLKITSIPPVGPKSSQYFKRQSSQEYTTYVHPVSNLALTSDADGNVYLAPNTGANNQKWALVKH